MFDIKLTKTWLNKRFRFVAVCGLAFVLAACDSLSFSEGTTEKPYEYPGIDSLQDLGNGVFQLSWPVAEVEGDASYEIYSFEMPAGELEPQSSATLAEAQKTWPFAPRPVETLKTTTWQTPKLTFKESTCYAVRINVGGLRDANQKMLCTKHEKFRFAGIESLGLAGSGRFRLAWAAVPDEDVSYAVYVRTGDGAYDFAAEPYARTGENLFETKNFPLNKSICFLVRFKSKNSDSDTNSKELCSSEDGVSDFAGVASVVSTYSGQATVSWVPSTNPNVKGYKIYQGSDFSKLISTASAQDSFTRIVGLPPGIRLEFGVRAFDNTGREDDNSKVISVVISDAQVVKGDFPGCLAATALDTSRIAVTVAFPPDSSLMRVYRDGILAGTLNPGSDTFTDQRLLEATKYTYTCEAVIGSLPTLGTNTVEATTTNVNAPNFAGLEKVEKSGAGTVKLSWSGVGDGPKANEMRIYKVLGPRPSNQSAAEFAESIFSSANLVATLAGNVTEATVSGLGDELQYSFSVSACSVSGLCAGQTKVVSTAMLEDEGFPKTPGATAVRMQNAKAVVTAPWADSMGGLALRKLYLRKGDCAAPSVCRQIGGFLYEFKQDFVVSDLYAPPLELEISGLASSTNYTFAVLDVDPSGNFSTSTASVTVNSGDTSPPVFSGVTGLARGSNPETEIIVSWNATSPEGTGSGQLPSGASEYLIFVTESAPADTPADACAASAPRVQLSALSYSLGQSVSHTLTGLTARRKYAVCVKARDTATNLSLTTVSQSLVTGDSTAPIFLGLQTLQHNASNSNLELRWNRASSGTSDVRDYRVTLWRCASGLNLSATGGVCKGAAGADVLNLSFADSTHPSGADVASSAFTPALSSSEKLSALVEVCDNASPTFANQDNCSASGMVRSLTLPDVDPPAGFQGITSASAVNGSQGAIRVGWAAPSPTNLWSDYAGFKVYTVNSSQTLTFVKDCLCPPAANGGCVTAPLTSCDVTGLEHARTYNFFVRAYDAAGNTTAVPATPFAQSRAAKTLDLTAPTFTAALNASFVNSGATNSRGVQLSWNEATDNQSNSESGNALVYRIYRSVGQAFTGLTSATPPTNGSLLASLGTNSYVDLLANLSASSAHHYAVCASDSSNNVSCDALTPRTVNVPRLASPVFAGIQSLTLGTGSGSSVASQDSTLTVGYTEIESEAASPSTGATDYQIWTSEATPPSTPNNACSDPAALLKATLVDITTNTQENIQTVISGLTQRKTYSVCVKARDSLGNQSVTNAALSATTYDLTAPSFNGLSNAAYNVSANAIDLSWVASSSSDIASYQIKIWKFVNGTNQSPTTITRTAASAGTGTTLTKAEFPFASSDTVRIVVQACDDAAPTFNTANNCTSFPDSAARELLLPDVDPPTGFTGVTSVTDAPSNSARTTGAIVVNWASMGANNADWSDVRGFRVYNVTDQATHAITLLKDCACSAYGCSERLTSCSITGLDAGRTYNIYVRAYDNAVGGGNESLIANPNPIANVRSIRTADLVAPVFTSSVLANWNGVQNGILLSWNAATDNQYALETGNTLGYRVFRKADTNFSAATRSAFEAEGTSLVLSPDSSLSLLDPVAGLVDGKTYYYAICAFDREPKLADGTAGTGNTSCTTSVGSAAVPDITPPVISNLRALDSSNNPITAATRAAPTFKLAWVLSDNTTSVAQTFVKVRRKITSSASDFPTAADALHASGTGMPELANESGPDDQNTFVNYLVTAEDLAGNATNQNISIASNRAALPTVFGSPSPSATVNSAGALSLPVTYTGGAASILDSAAYLAKLSLTVTSGNPSCTPNVSGTGLAGRTITLSNCTGNGTLTLSLATGTATDAQSNASSAAGPSSVVTVDNTPPTVAITAPVAAAQIAAATGLTVSGTCSENGRSVNIGGSGVSVGASPTCTSGTFSGTVTLVAGSGSKSITATLADLAGNSTTSSAVSVNLDTTAPVVSLIAPADGAGGTTGILFSGTCESDLLVYFAGDVLGGTQTASCSAGSFSASISFSAGEGLKNIQVSQIDLAGNASATIGRSVYRDQTKPLVTISAPSATIVRSASSTTFTLNFSDTAGSGVNTVNLSSGSITQNTTGGATCPTVNLGGTGAASRSVTLSGCTGNGTISISVAAGIITDAAGNTSDLAGPSATFVVDNTAPVLAATSPTENTAINSAFTLTGICESGIAVTVSSTGLSSSPQNTPCTNGAFSIALSLSGSDGNKSLSLSQTDAAGNTATSTRIVARDTTAPSLNISAPAASTAFNSTDVASALSGPCQTGLTVVLEGDVVANQSTSCTAGGFSFANWALTSGDGSKTVTVAQTDSAGNKGTASRLFVLDTAPVPPTSAVVFDSVTLLGLKGTVTGQCDSDPAYATNVAVTSNNATIFSQSCVANVLTVNLTNMREGRNTVSLNATVTRLANGATLSTPASFSQQFFCPQGYTGVPGKFATESDVAGLGNVNASANNADGALDPTRDFCVMKYPAKVATSNSGGQSAWEPVYDGNKTFTMAHYWPQSRADSTPWVNISRTNAEDRCKALNEAHGLCTGANCYLSFNNSQWGYGLMSNTQWQVTARNMEKTGANWTGGAENSGFLWRGHSDAAVGSNTDLFTQTFNGGTQLSLSNPRRDTGVSDYFGTGNNVTQNTSGSAGWQERRRFVLSNGASIWDMAGNIWQWVRDNNTGNAGDMGASSDLRAANTWWQHNNAGLTASDKLLFSPAGPYTSTQNAGHVYGSSAGAVLRGGYWNYTSGGGLFAADLGGAPSFTNLSYIGFRCAFFPPPAPMGPLDSGAPGVPTVGRVDGNGTSITNAAVTVAAGGLWHLAVTNVTDAENTGVNATKLRVKVRRKIASTNTDFPTTTDPVYRGGFNNPNSFNVPDTNNTTQQSGFISVTDGKLYLSNETAWTFNEDTGRYTRNDGSFVNYRVEVYDPAGNSSSTTYSVQVTQSCPPGYVGVPGKAPTDADVAGLGNVNASAGNADKSLDPTQSFCVMKYPAKVMSAGTTAAQSTVGGLFEPIQNGNGTFTNTYTYTNTTTFNSGVTYLPTSRFSGTPWVTINRDNSSNACRALQMQYFGSMPDTTANTGFQLISNTQWQVVARNAELVATNWSNNAVGSGVLARGHSDNVISTTETTNSWCFGCTAPSTSLSGAPNSIFDGNSYFATGPASSYNAFHTLGASPAAGAEQKRTHTLSNGVTVWDFAGNIWQWVRDNNTGTAGDMGAGSDLRAATATWWQHNNAGLTTGDKLLFSPAGPYTSSQNAGQIYGGAGGAVLRGGSWDLTSFGGLFAAYPSCAPSSTSNGIGFRCAFFP